MKLYFYLAYVNLRNGSTLYKELSQVVKLTSILMSMKQVQNILWVHRGVGKAGNIMKLQIQRKAVSYTRYPWIQLQTVGFSVSVQYYKYAKRPARHHRRPIQQALP